MFLFNYFLLYDCIDVGIDCMYLMLRRINIGELLNKIGYLNIIFGDVLFM